MGHACTQTTACLPLRSQIYPILADFPLENMVKMILAFWHGLTHNPTCGESPLLPVIVPEPSPYTIPLDFRWFNGGWGGCWAGWQDGGIRGGGGRGGSNVKSIFRGWGWGQHVDQWMTIWIYLLGKLVYLCSIAKYFCLMHKSSLAVDNHLQFKQVLK